MKKLLLVNGSPRVKGNTEEALNILKEEASKNFCEVTTINIVDYSIKGCIGCCSCKLGNNKCSLENDDMAMLLKKVEDADYIVFGTPVYWWGMTSQLKQFLDRFYSKLTIFQNLKKKVGILIIGAAPVSDKEYDLISSQMECICRYLNWDFVFYERYSAIFPGEILKDNKNLESLKKVLMKF